MVDLELKLWNMMALAAIGLVWWAIQRYFKSIDKRFDAQDIKLDKIIEIQQTQAKQILIHNIILNKHFPDFIVNYPD